QDPLPVLAVAGVDRELAHPLALAAGAGYEVDSLQLAARLGDRGRQFAERLLPRVELDPDRDAVLGTHCHRSAIESNSLLRFCEAVVRWPSMKPSPTGSGTCSAPARR